MSAPPSPPLPPSPRLSASDPLPARSPVLAGLAAGLKAGCTSVFIVVLVGSYVSIGALAHDLGFPLPWIVLSTVLVWAAPAQVILITALGAGAAPFEIALAVTLSGVRLLPMVVALLPILKGPTTRPRDVILPAHFTAISMWVEALRLAPKLPRGERIAFANGLGLCFMSAAAAASIVGYHLAAALPRLIVAALLFLTPVSFLISVVRNASIAADRVALVLGLVLAPLLAWRGIELDLLWTGLIGGTVAYAAHRLSEALR
jgi:predicted branched-subunit amino acid permease